MYVRLTRSRLPSPSANVTNTASPSAASDCSWPVGKMSERLSLNSFTAVLSAAIEAQNGRYQRIIRMYKYQTRSLVTGEGPGDDVDSSRNGTGLSSATKTHHLHMEHYGIMPAAGWQVES